MILKLKPLRIIFNHLIVSRRTLPVIALSLLYLLCEPSPAPALIGDTNGAFGLDGSFKFIGSMYDYYRLPPFYTNERGTDHAADAILRLTAAGRPTDRLSYEMHLVQSLDYSSAKNAGLFSSNQIKSRYKALDDTWDSNEDRDVSTSTRLDRINFKLSFTRADVTVGRQAITFGKAYFWNPLDVYLPFDPQTLDRDYKAGVDAIRLDIPLGYFSGLNLIGVLGREITPEGEYENEDRRFDSSWYGSSLLVRLFTNIADWDLALQGGKIYGGYQIGIGAVGELGKIETRFEAAYFSTDEDTPMPSPYEGDLLKNHWTAVLGVGRRFENSLTFEMEYLYNGAGDDDDLEASLFRLSHGSIQHLSEHLLGFMANYEITPLITAQLVCIYSISDKSSQFQPTLFISLADEVDLVCGATLSRGAHPDKIYHPLTFNPIPILNSEFGSYPDVYFIELKVYF